MVDCPRYEFGAPVVKHTLVLNHDCQISGDKTRTDLGVGERVGLYFWSDLFTNAPTEQHSPQYA